MTHRFIDVAEVGGVLVITMNDPPTRNAIGSEMAEEINREVDRLESDPTLRALVLTGRDPSFCSGANVRRMDEQARESRAELTIPPDVGPAEFLEQKWKELEDGAYEVEEGEGVRFIPLRLDALQKPSIAAVNGYAMGLGLGIALSCDIRIASEKARMAETFIRRGLIPADGSCWQLPRMIGLGNTLLLQYTGDVTDAEQALRLGMVNVVTRHEDLMETTMELAQRLAAGPTYTMGLIKRLVQGSLNSSFEEHMRLARPAQDIARATEDHREGVRSFIEKRKAEFKGR